MIKVVGFPHPFLASHEEHEVEPGLTYAEIVEIVRRPDNFASAVVFLRDEEIPESRRGETPPDGATVIVRMVPAGSAQAAGEGMGKGGFWTFMAGALLMFIPGMQLWGLALCGLGIGSMLLGAAVTNGLFAKPRSATENSPSLSGSSNSPNPWGAVPVVLGKHLITPYYAGSPYTEIGGTDGADQYLRLLFVVGYGPLRVSNIKIGDNMLATNAADVRSGTIDTSTGNYTDVNLEIQSSGTHSTLYPAMVVEEQIGVELKASDAATAHIYTTPKATTRIEAEIVFPSGLASYNSSGDKGSRTVAVTAYYRLVGSGSWSTLGTFSITKSKTQTMRFNVGANVTAGEYEVRLARTTADKDEGDTKIIDQVNWLCLRSFRATYPIDDSVASDFVVLALKIKATDQLSGVVDKLNLIAEGVYPAYDGSGSGSSNWVAGVTSNPAAAFLWYLRGPMNPRPVPNALVDWALLEEWYTYCGTAGFTCDAVVTADSTLADILKMIAVTGRASPTLRDGLYSVVIDKARSTPVQFFTPANSRDFLGSKAFPEAIHGYRISFVNRDADYSPDEAIVLDDNYLFDIDSDGYLEDSFGTHRSVGGSYVLATLFEEITLWGVVTASNAWKHGRYLLAIRRLRPEVFQLTAGISSLRCQRGDLVSVAHDVPMLGLAYGRVKTLVTGTGGVITGITTNEACPMEVGVTYVISIQNDAGTIIERTVVNPGAGEYTSLTFTASIPAGSAPAVDSMFAFGESGLESVDMILAGIEGLEDLEANLQFVEYNAAIYTADTGTIPTYVSKTTKAKTFLPAQVVDDSGNQAPDVTIGAALQSRTRVLTALTDVGLYDDEVAYYLGRYYQWDLAGTAWSAIDAIAPSPSGLAGLWRCDELGTDGIVPDNSGAGVHATAVGPVLASSIFGKALSFDGSNDYATLDATKVTGTGAFTWCFRVQGKASRAATQYLYSRDSAVSGGYGIRCVVTSSNRATLIVSGGGTTLTNLASPAGTEITDDCTLAFEFIPSTSMRILKNGVEIASLLTGVPALAYYSASQVAQFGAVGSTHVNSLDGWLSGIAYYTRALTASEHRGYALGLLPDVIYSGVDWKTDPTNPINVVAVQAPRYLGLGQLAALGTAAFPGYNVSAPVFTGGVITTYAAVTSGVTVTPHVGDYMANYAGSVATGVYLFTGSAWTKTGVTAEMRSAAMEDIHRLNCLASPIELTEGATFDELVAYSVTTKYLKATQSLRVGDRFDKDGAIADGTKPGFFVGASGIATLAGCNFEGSQGGGVQWGGGQQVGSGLTISGCLSPALAALNNTDVAFADSAGGQLFCYRFNGSAWSLIGSGFTVGGNGAPSLAALNGTDVAFIDSANDQLRCYRFNGSTWSLVGSGLAISGCGVPSLAALNGTDVAFIDANNEQLCCYRFNGSTWSLVGSGLAISGFNSSALTALNGTDVAFIDSANDQLRCYRFDGSTWSLVGSGLAISGCGVPSLAALNGTDVAFIDSTNDQLRCYRFSGTAWAQVSSAGSPTIGGGVPALAALNGTDVAFIDSTNDQLRCYRYAFALSVPWRYPFSG